MERPGILFVCLGNICRSPLAEAAFRHEAARLDIDVSIDSAGTGDWHVGEPPDKRAQAEASRHGHDISHYRARQINTHDFLRFSHIFALDEQNLANLTALAPAGATARIALLMDCVAGMKGRSVADPYFGQAEGFGETWRDVSLAARCLAEGFARDRTG